MRCTLLLPIRRPSGTAPPRRSRTPAGAAAAAEILRQKRKEVFSSFAAGSRKPPSFSEFNEWTQKRGTRTPGVRIPLDQWIRRESNPCPKAYSLSFYYRSLFFLPVFLRPFPPASEKSRHPDALGSFMIRLRGQSLTRIVSHIVDARVLRCECLKPDSRHQAAYAKLSSAFIFRFVV